MATPNAPTSDFSNPFASSSAPAPAIDYDKLAASIVAAQLKAAPPVVGTVEHPAKREAPSRMLGACIAVWGPAGGAPCLGLVTREYAEPEGMVDAVVFVPGDANAHARSSLTRGVDFEIVE